MAHTPNTGYKIAEDLLRKGNNDITLLLEKAQHRENSYLEFKADIFYRDEFAQKSEKQDDFTWHVLQALIAFANTHGGCLLIGLDDNGKDVIPLRDKKGNAGADIDKYLRELDSVLFSKTKLSIRHENEKNPNRVIIEMIHRDELKCLVEMRRVIYKGKTLIALLVKGSEKPLWYKKDETEVFIRRETNGAAKNISLRPSEVNDYWNNIRPGITIGQTSSPREYYNNIPSPNDSFIGRVEELKKLHRILSETPNKIPIICGEAGVGKTELLKQFSQIYRSEYETVIELDASEKRNIPQIFQLILEDHKVTEKYDLEQFNKDKRAPIRCKNILRKLAESGDKILIILNDLASSSVFASSEVNEYLRNKENIHICATSRITAWHINDTDPICPLKMTGLPTEDGEKLLESKCPAANDNERKAIVELIEYFEGNAWALDLIGEILKQSGKTQNAYTQMLQSIKKTPWKNIISNHLKENVVISNPCNSFAEIMNISINQISWAAGRMAHIAAIGDPNFICADFLKAVFQALHRQFSSDSEFDIAMTQLQSWNILTACDKAPGGKIFRMSRLTQFALIQEMGVEYFELRKFLLQELLNVLKSGEKKYDMMAWYHSNSLPSFEKYYGKENNSAKHTPVFFQTFHTIESEADQKQTPKTEMESILSILSDTWDAVEKLATDVESAYNSLMSGTSSKKWLDVVFFFLPTLLTNRVHETDQEKFSEFVHVCLEKISNIDEIFNLHKQNLTKKSMELLLILHYIVYEIIVHRKMKDEFLQYAAQWYIHMFVLLNRSPQKEKTKIQQILRDFELMTTQWQDEFMLHYELLQKKDGLRKLLLTYSLKN